jgi:hypothetical protein
MSFKRWNRRFPLLAFWIKGVDLISNFPNNETFLSLIRTHSFSSCESLSELRAEEWVVHNTSKDFRFFYFKALYLQGLNIFQGNNLERTKVDQLGL